MLLSRFLFHWIHQNRRYSLFLFPVACSLSRYTFPYIFDSEL